MNLGKSYFPGVHEMGQTFSLKENTPGSPNARLFAPLVHPHSRARLTVCSLDILPPCWGGSTQTLGKAAQKPP